MAAVQNKYSGQAQHLADWKARQKQAQGKIIAFPIQTQITEEEARCWQEKAMDMIGVVIMVAAMVLGTAVTVVQLGFEKGWW